MNEIIHTYAASFVFIHICRTYAAFCSTDVLAAAESLRETIESDMPRHNDLSARINFKVTFCLDTSCRETVEFTDEVLRIENYTCADKAECVGVENTGRNEVEFIDLAVVYNGMTGIVAALRANDYVSA